MTGWLINHKVQNIREKVQFVGLLFAIHLKIGSVNHEQIFWADFFSKLPLIKWNTWNKASQKIYKNECLFMCVCTISNIAWFYKTSTKKQNVGNQNRGG